MAKGSAYVVLRVDFEGDYYRPDEWIGMVDGWVYRATDDRDDVVCTAVTASWIEED